jgi:hypothetical protein
MYPRSSSLDLLVHDSNTAAFDLSVFAPNDPSRTPIISLTDLDLVITDGQIACDSTEKIRRTGNITLTGNDRTIPQALGDIFAPLGNQIQLGRGVILPDGTREVLPLAVVEVQDVHLSDSGDSVELTLDVSDRSQIVSRRKFTTAYSIAAGTNVVTAIQGVLQTRYPEVVYNTVVPTVFTTPAQHYQVGGDPMEKVNQLAASIGYQAYFDRLGLFNITPLPTLSNSLAVWTFTEGDDCMILSNQRRLSAEGFANHIIVQGQSGGDDQPVLAEAAIGDSRDDRSIPRLGDIPDVRQRNDLNNAAQAYAFAQAELVKAASLIETLNMVTLVHPAFEANDIIQVESPRSKTTGFWIQTNISIPFTHTRGMNVVCQRAS